MAFALAYVVLSILWPDLQGGLLIFAAGPIIFLALWAAISSLVTLCILSRPDGCLRSGAGIGYGLLLIITVLGITFLIATQHHNNQG